MAWILATVALVIVGGSLQAWLTASEGRSKTVAASGLGAIAAHGAIDKTSTNIRLSATASRKTRRRSTAADVLASGDGSIASGDKMQGVKTNISDL